MSTIINGYYIETGYGFDINHSTVTEVKGSDKYNRIKFGECVFQGTWSECEEYARTH